MSSYARLDGLSVELIDAIVSDVSTRDRISLAQASQYLHGLLIPTIYRSWSYNGHRNSSKSLYCFLRTMIIHPLVARHVKILDISNFKERVNREKNDGPDRRDDDVAYKDNFEILLQALRDLGLDERTATRYERGILDQDENYLLALVISRLPNLEILQLFVPRYWKPVYNMLLYGTRSTSTICQKLHTVYIGQTRTINARGSSECFLSVIDSILPISQIPGLRSLYTLTSHAVETPRSLKTIRAYTAKTLNLTELVLDESLIAAEYLLKLITLPRALTAFRWGQVDDSIFGSRPSSSLQRILVEGLSVHKDTLASLDLNGISPDPTVRRPTHGVRNKHLIKSLKHFVVLKKLSIPALAVFGNITWGLAPHRIIDVLPPSLETLSLRVNVILLGPEQKVEGSWMDQMVEMVLKARDMFPALRQVALVVSNDWRQIPGDDEPFGTLKNACVRSRIGFEVTKGTMFGISPDAYFQRMRKERESY